MEDSHTAKNHGHHRERGAVGKSSTVTATLPTMVIVFFIFWSIPPPGASRQVCAADAWPVPLAGPLVERRRDHGPRVRSNSYVLRLARAAESSPAISEADAWTAGAWDVACLIDPIFLTDAISWWFELED